MSQSLLPSSAVLQLHSCLSSCSDCSETVRADHLCGAREKSFPNEYCGDSAADPAAISSWSHAAGPRSMAANNQTLLRSCDEVGNRLGAALLLAWQAFRPVQLLVCTVAPQQGCSNSKFKSLRVYGFVWQDYSSNSAVHWQRFTSGDTVIHSPHHHHVATPSSCLKQVSE